MSRRQPTWLWWLALAILAFGGLLAYLIFLQPANPEKQIHMNLVLAVSVVSAGICIICATADWWIQH